MAKYKIYYMSNGQKEKIDETNSKKDFFYLLKEYRLAYGIEGKNISHNFKMED